MGGWFTDLPGVIFHETRHHAQAHITSGTLVHCALSLAARRTQTAAQLGWWFCWPVFVMATSAEACCCFSSSSSSSSSSPPPPLPPSPPPPPRPPPPRQRRRRRRQWWFRVSVSNQNFTDGFLLKFYFFLAIAWDLQSSASFRLLCMSGHSCRNVISVRYECLLQWQQNRSKATMWLLYKFPAIQGCPRRCY